MKGKGRHAAAKPRATSAAGARSADPLPRREFLKAGLAAVCALGARVGAASGVVAPPRMPAVFVGHGSPMNAIEDNAWSRGLRALARTLPRPKAILAVSAHWYVDGTFTTGNDRPRTIHDFGGFPDALFRVQYPAPGNPDLARRVVGLVGGRRASVSSAWGLDHGTWSVLVHLRPDADVPVVQLSIDGRLEPAEHLAIGRALAPLRDEGVLLLGSGNLVHNLGHALGAWRRGETRTPEWAREFDLGIARAVERHDAGHLIGALASDAGRLSHPTPDHYLRILYAAGASTQDDAVRFPVQGFDKASLSMRSVVFG